MNWFGNFACTINGIVGTKGGQLIISNEEDWNIVHHLRHHSAGIAVGSGTILNENPSLRTKDKYVSNPKQPVPIIFDRRGKIDRNYKVFSTDKSQNAIWITNSQLSYEGVTKIEYTNLKDVKIKINQVLDAQFGRNEKLVMVEGGPTLITSLCNESVIDFIRIFRSSNFVPKGQIMFNNSFSAHLELKSVNKLGDGVVTCYGVGKDTTDETKQLVDGILQELQK